MATISRDENIEDYSRRLQFYRLENEYYPEQWEQVQALVAEGSSAILACASPREAAAKLLEYKESINQISTKKQIIANAELDPAKLIYSTNRRGSSRTRGRRLAHTGPPPHAAGPARLYAP